MKIDHDLMSSIAVRKFKNILWAIPYLAVMGMIWGYLAAATLGATIGLLVAAVSSVIIGMTTERGCSRSA